ncbi:MAG: ACT domain-containing protein [Clostridia bacterium]|nr:ACT domain-containing protein [Clostridia bacterium]
MRVEQISVFLENKPGRLAKVARLLGDNQINIRALSVADTADFGILRIIVADPQKTFELLKAHGYIVTKTEVIAVEVPDRPGGMADILEFLQEAQVNIEYTYAFVQKGINSSLVVFRVEDPERAEYLFAQHGIRVINGEEIGSI